MWKFFKEAKWYWWVIWVACGWLGWVLGLGE